MLPLESWIIFSKCLWISNPTSNNVHNDVDPQIDSASSTDAEDINSDGDVQIGKFCLFPTNLNLNLPGGTAERYSLVNPRTKNGMDERDSSNNPAF